jgi:hypothetical protein
MLKEEKRDTIMMKDKDLMVNTGNRGRDYYYGNRNKSDKSKKRIGNQTTRQKISKQIH